MPGMVASLTVLPVIGVPVNATALNGYDALSGGGLALLLGLSEGDALLFTVLGASASHIAVPAAMRLALPTRPAP